MGIGVAIGEKSLLGVIGCIVAVLFVMGMGFKAKAKMRANGELIKESLKKLLYFTICHSLNNPS